MSLAALVFSPWYRCLKVAIAKRGKKRKRGESLGGYYQKGNDTPLTSKPNMIFLPTIGSYLLLLNLQRSTTASHIF